MRGPEPARRRSVLSANAPTTSPASASTRVVVRAPYFELFRATTGRRTEAEITSYEWEPAPDLDMILAAPFFTIRTDSLDE